mgnify:CR=1 FL=1
MGTPGVNNDGRGFVNFYNRLFGPRTDKTNTKFTVPVGSSGQIEKTNESGFYRWACVNN